MCGTTRSPIQLYPYGLFPSLRDAGWGLRAQGAAWQGFLPWIINHNWGAITACGVWQNYDDNML